MLITTRFAEEPGVARTTRTVLPPLVQPCPPVGNLPSAAGADGPLSRLAQRLRITPNGVGTFLHNAVVQRGDAPHGLHPPALGGLRQPVAADRQPEARIVRRRKRAVGATAGSAARGPVADRRASVRAQAVDALRQRFGGEGEGVETLVDRLMDFATAPPLAFERPLLIGCLLSRLTGGNAVLGAELLRALCTAEPAGGAYGLQRALARCGGAGIDCLMALHPPAVVPADPVLAAIQREAYAARLRAADAIQQMLPAAQRQHSLADCVRRAGLTGAPLVENRILVDGLACAQALVEDPGAEVPQAQRAAYLALRNGLLTPERLARAQQRLFKVNIYIDRASERGIKRTAHGLQRLTGYRKSPLNALTQLGTAQSKTRHPEDDLAARTVVMDAFVAQLEAHLAGHRQWPTPDEATVRRAVRIAVVRRWKQRIVDRGWRDGMPVGRRWRAAIATEAAARLGCDVEQVAGHPALKSLRRLNAETLSIWSDEECIDHALPVQPGDARSYRLALARFREMHNHGDVILRRPTAGQTRELLHNAIADTRQTYSVAFAQGGTVGLQGSVIDLLSLTPAVAGVGPSVALLGGRGAFLTVGSNVHGGQLQVGSQRSGRVDAGVVGFAGKRLGDVLNLGLTLSLMPLQLERSHVRATVLRTRMNVFGADQPTAWMDLLLDAYDAITWKEGEEGPPADAEEMWNQLARRFYKNPSLSIDDLQAHQTSVSGSATAILGARVAIGQGVQVGPAATVGGSRVYVNRLRQHDSGANRATEQNTDSASRGITASVGLTGLAPGITGGAIHAHAAEPGATQSLTLTTANLANASVGLLRNAAGVTMRLVTDQGRIDADYSVMDTECGTAAAFARYLDTRRADWLAALGGDAAAAQTLDVFLTRIVAEEKRGNVTYGERRRITPLAARRVDHFRAMAAALAGGTQGQPDRRARAEIKRLEGEVGRVLDDPGSWDARSLWVLDLNLNISGKGLSIILQAVSRKTASAPRQRAVLVASHAPNRAVTDTGAAGAA